MDRAGLERYLRAEVSRSPLALSFVGNVDADSVENLVKEARKNGGSRPRRALQQSAAELTPGAQLEEDPAAKQTSIVALCPVARYGEPDFVTGLGLRWVLGGSFPRRIADRFASENVHPDRAVIDMNARPSGVLVFVEASVPSAQAGGAVRAILDHFSALAENGPGAEDMAQARRAAIEGTISFYDSIKTHLQVIAALGRPEVDVSWPVLAYRRAQSLTAADVQGLAKRCAATLHIAAVGQVKEIAAELTKRKFGPVGIHPAPEAR